MNLLRKLLPVSAIHGIRLTAQISILLQGFLQIADLLLRQLQKGLTQRPILVFVAFCHLNPSLLPAFP